MSGNKAIIFDLDGTLWDATAGITAAWQEIIDSENIAVTLTQDDVKDCMGLPMNEIFLRLIPNIGDDLRVIMQKKCQQHENEYLAQNSGVLYPNVEHTLIRLKNDGYDLYIVTNSQDGYVEAFFDSTGLKRYFTDYEMFGRTGLLKAENILLVMSRNRIDKAVYVGDAQGDCDSSKIAKIPFVFAKYGFGRVADYEYGIDSFDKLTEIIGKIL